MWSLSFFRTCYFYVLLFILKLSLLSFCLHRANLEHLHAELNAPTQFKARSFCVFHYFCRYFTWLGRSCIFGFKFRIEALPLGAFLLELGVMELRHAKCWVYGAYLSHVMSCQMVSDVGWGISMDRGHEQFGFLFFVWFAAFFLSDLRYAFSLLHLLCVSGSPQWAYVTDSHATPRDNWAHCSWVLNRLWYHGAHKTGKIKRVHIPNVHVKVGFCSKVRCTFYHQSGSILPRPGCIPNMDKHNRPCGCGGPPTETLFQLCFSGVLAWIFHALACKIWIDVRDGLSIPIITSVFRFSYKLQVISWQNIQKQREISVLGFFCRGIYWNVFDGRVELSSRRLFPKCLNSIKKLPHTMFGNHGSVDSPKIMGVLLLVALVWAILGIAAQILHFFLSTCIQYEHVPKMLSVVIFKVFLAVISVLSSRSLFMASGLGILLVQQVVRQK